MSQFCPNQLVGVSCSLRRKQFFYGPTLALSRGFRRVLPLPPRNAMPMIEANLRRCYKRLMNVIFRALFCRDDSGSSIGSAAISTAGEAPASTVCSAMRLSFSFAVRRLRTITEADSTIVVTATVASKHWARINRLRLTTRKWRRRRAGLCSRRNREQPVADARSLSPPSHFACLLLNQIVV